MQLHNRIYRLTTTNVYLKQAYKHSYRCPLLSDTLPSPQSAHGWLWLVIYCAVRHHLALLLVSAVVRFQRHPTESEGGKCGKTGGLQFKDALRAAHVIKTVHR